MRSGLVVSVLILSSTVSSAALVNRWSFAGASGAITNGTVFADSVNGASALVQGLGASGNGVSITLPGNTTGDVGQSAISAYVDLPNGLVSSKANLTIEIWATPLSFQTWQRLIDFGNMDIAGLGGGAAGEVTGNGTIAPGGTSSSDNLMLALSRGASLGEQRLEGRLDGGTSIVGDTDLPTVAGTQYHYVLVFDDQAGTFGAAGGQLRWYRDGAFVSSVDLGFHLAALNDVNNWLGRSQWSGDSNANVALSEVRIYDEALSEQQILASYAAGPDANFGEPTALQDTYSMHRGQKALIPVLANDSGAIDPGTVTVVQPPVHGTATAQTSGRVLYAHTGGADSSDTFTYKVAGPGGTSEPATVTVLFADTLRLTNNTLNVPANPPPTAIQLQTAFTGFSQPLCIATPPGETNRIFVCQKGGLLRVVPNLAAGPASSSVFFNLPALLSSRGEAISTGSEQGLLGLAFHPGYATNGFFYLFYSVTRSGSTYERLSRFSVQTANTNAADTTSELVLIEQFDQAGNHNGGDLHFGPDGYLYVALGDEGGGNDQYNNSQKINGDFFSGLLRIDVDKKPGSLDPNTHAAVIRDAGVARYAIPSDNPFVGATRFNGISLNPSSVRTEFWAVGLRNPWRFSFDEANGDLWVGDVGQDRYEEVDLVTKGGNYGWAYREGKHAGPKSPTAGFTSIDPIYEYNHGSGALQGNSITGGRIYRGTRISSLVGAYVFADYVSGNIWSLRRTNTTVSVVRITGEGGIVGFGEDPSNGDLLLADIDGGRILRLVSSTPAGSFPATLSDTGLFADLADLSPNPGLLPYEPNLAFWSDHAIKRRWFIVPDATNTLTWSRNEPWTYPAGMVWVKHFDLEMDRGNPATKKRIETRLIVKNASGAYGVSYLWNATGTEATLAPDEGVDFALNVTNAGIVAEQNWHVPSRAECLVCHKPQAGYSLSFNTRQLNRTNVVHGFAGNQLDLLRAAGYLANQPDPVNTLPRHHPPIDDSVSLEARVRSYLAVNCAYCHQAGGTAPTAWDGRPELTLDATGLVNGSANNNGGDPANKLIVPGDVLHSIVYHRAGATNGFTRMPPLATSEVDAANLALLARWITDSLPARQSFAQWQTSTFGSSENPDAAAGEDPDHDLQTNQEEFLTGTNPKLATSRFAPSLGLTGGIVSLAFDLPTNRSFQIEVSTNLTAWTVWNAPGNDGSPGPGGEESVTGAAVGDQEYFRVRLWDN
jgi:uncharacterized repeat protein (TIGR03806 family)